MEAQSPSLLGAHGPYSRWFRAASAQVADLHTGARCGEVPYDAPEYLRSEPALDPLPRIQCLTAFVGANLRLEPADNRI